MRNVLRQQTNIAEAHGEALHFLFTPQAHHHRPTRRPLGVVEVFEQALQLLDDRFLHRVFQPVQLHIQLANRPGERVHLAVGKTVILLTPLLHPH